MKSVILLPKRIRNQLMAAGEINNYSERRKTVDRIIDLAKRNHPECFIQDEEVPTQPQEKDDVS